MMRWRLSTTPALKNYRRPNRRLPHSAGPCNVAGMGNSEHRSRVAYAVLRPRKTEKHTKLRNTLGGTEGQLMSIDRRTVVTGLVSAGALLQSSTHGQAASGPEINASVGATLER